VKTPKILVALIFVLGFTFNNVNAQVEKWEYTVDPFTVDIPCLYGTGEVLTGSAVYTGKSWGSDGYTITCEGVVTDHLGIEYTVTNKWRVEDGPLGGTLDGGNILQLRRRGKLVALIHSNTNYINEGGEPVLQVYQGWTVCW
jgi:hypothetical protein